MMNEISRIHLARVSYEIDVAAKKELEKYLTAVKRSLGQETDAMEDIEIRMTEILASRGVVQDSVVTGSDVKAVIEQLGEPKDFASDDVPASGGPTTEGAKKRYYRDPENAVLGGVIAGLAAYTGWDVTLLRVLAVVLTIIPSWGTLIIVYIVVWICAPEAKSVSEKMEMRGEPVNLGSLKESAKNFSEKAEGAGREMAEKASEVGKKIEEQAPQIGNTIGRVLLMIIGITGVVVWAIILCGLVITGIWLIPILVAGANIGAVALLIVTVGLAFGCAFMIAVAGIVLSSILIDGQPKKHSTGLLVTILIALALMVSASVTGVAWVSTVGREGIDRVTDLVNSTVRVDIDGDDENVKVEIKPFRINVETSK